MAIVAANPHILVCDRHARAWPADPGKEPDPAEYGPADAAFTTAFPFDAHTTGYSLSTIEHRLRGAALAAGAAPKMVLLVFDIDTPGHVPITAAWWAQEEPKIRALIHARGRCYVWTSRNGYKIAYGIEPVTIGLTAPACHPQRWTASYHAWCVELAAEFGIIADKSCGDWTRLMRLPRVNRDGEDVVPLHEVGEPDRMSYWRAPLLAADDPRCLPPPPREVPTALAAPVPEDRLIEAAAALADAWPDRGRHYSTLMLCGVLAGLGWSEEAIADFVIAVCGAAGDDDVAHHEKCARDACDRAARGETLAGWPKVAEHMATGADGTHDPARDELAAAAVLVARRALGDAPPEETWAGAIARIKEAAPAARAQEVRDQVAEIAAVVGISVAPDEAAQFAANLDWAAEQFLAQISALGSKDAAAPQRLFVTARELFAQNHPPPQWLIRGLITRGGIGVIGGEPKASKTWAGLDCVIAVATGTPALGKYAVDRPGRVAYFFAEDDPGSVTKRGRALIKPRGLACDDWQDRMILQPRGRTLDLAKDLDCAILIGSARHMFPDGLDLLVLDPLSDLHSGEEDKRDSMAPLMRRLRTIAAVLGCALVVVHHTSKSTADTRQRRPGQRLRGSGAVHGAVDFGIYLDFDEDASATGGAGPSKFVNVVTSEVKAASDAGKFGLTLTVTDDADGQATDARWSVGDPPAAPTGAAAADEKVAVVCQRLFDHGHPLTRDDLRRKIGGAADVLARAIALATEAGYIAVRMNGGRPSGYELTDAGRDFVRSGRAPAERPAAPGGAPPTGGVSGFLARLTQRPGPTP